MSYLGLALVAEGSSDHRFLPSVLYRLTEDLCLNHGRGTVEVGPVTSLEPSDSRAANYTDRLVDVANQAAGTYHVLFLHSDGGGDGEAARRERTNPWARALEALGREQERSVAVVPVREMEAWAMCDGEALRQAFGTTLDDTELGVPERSGDVERLLDPKQSLQTAYDGVFRPRRARRSVAGLLEAIAERIRLDRLRQVPAFARLDLDLHQALRDLRYTD